MDEITIGEKKYVSSKRAAQMTGYAKDYVGQLCREGRVPARLVGRSWYVLESAIKDHRFGDKETKEEPTEKPVVSVHEEATTRTYETWEAPKYHAEALTAIDLVTETETPADAGAMVHEASDLQAAWKEWFDRFPKETQGLEGEDTSRGVVEEEAPSDVAETSVPVHVMSRPEVVPAEPARFMPGEDLGVPPAYYAQAEGSQPTVRRVSRRRRLFLPVRTMLVLVMLPFLALAVLGSGIIDDIVISSNQAQYFAGITVYNK